VNDAGYFDKTQVFEFIEFILRLLLAVAAGMSQLADFG